MLRGMLALLICSIAAAVYAEPRLSDHSRPGAQGQSFYRYKGSTGRPVYTNVGDQVPLDQRADAEIDLSRISLNTAVGNEIARRNEQEHAALTQTPFCQQVRAAALKPFHEQLWDEYAPLLVAAAVLLLLLIVSPSAMRKFGVSGWTQLLSFAIPAVFALGLIIFSLDKTRASVAQARAKAQPCAPGALAALGNETGVLQKHAALIDRLKRDIAAVDSESAR